MVAVLLWCWIGELADNGYIVVTWDGMEMGVGINNTYITGIMKFRFQS